LGGGRWTRDSAATVERLAGRLPIGGEMGPLQATSASKTAKRMRQR
jgi:hypothetical protein